MSRVLTFSIRKKNIVYLGTMKLMSLHKRSVSTAENALHFLWHGTIGYNGYRTFENKNQLETKLGLREEIVATFFNINQRRSLRTSGRDKTISRSLIQRMIRNGPDNFTYKIQISQRLKACHYATWT